MVAWRFMTRKTAACSTSSPPTGIRKPHVDLHPTLPIASVTSYHGQSVKVLDLETGRILDHFKVSQYESLYMTQWSPDGRTLAVPVERDSNEPDAEGKVRRCIWLHPFDPATRRFGPPRSIIHFAEGLVAMFNPAGDHLVTTSWGNSFGLLDVNTGRARSDRRAMDLPTCWEWNST